MNAYPKTLARLSASLTQSILVSYYLIICLDKSSFLGCTIQKLC